MQSIRRLQAILDTLADPDHYLFAISDLASALPDLTYKALKALLSRAAKQGIIRRVCRGVYIYPRIAYTPGFELYHAAARLRAHHFNYLSLETVLSETGVISQVPLNWITVMSSGRSHHVSCGSFGTIEFVHTKKRPNDVAGDLTFDERRRLWRASVRLALRDMRATGRSLDLIDWSVVDELV